MRALLPGLGLGVVLILLELISFALLPDVPENMLTMLARAVLIYAPPGALIGWHVKRRQVAYDVRLLPPASHALLGCLLLAPPTPSCCW